MVRSRLVLLLIVLFGLPIAGHAAGRFDQKEVDAAIKSFLSAQKSEQEDTDSLGSAISDLDNFDSFECRGRNRVVGAQLSEHGRANALDVRAFKLANGRSISLTDRTVARELRESVLHSACTRFSTVLGPGSDWYHEDHIHLDLMERRNNYRICQWNVWDPLPQVAPLLPAERPEEAPPREVAEKSDSKATTTKSGDVEPDAEAKPAKPEPKKPTKKRR